MTGPELLNHLRIDVERYTPDCAAAIKRDGHMNAYDGQEPVSESEVRGWLGGFCEEFATRYKGLANTGDVLMGMAACAKGWRTHTGLTGSQATKDAVIVSFINFCGMRRGCDFAMYTCDLTT